MSVESAETRELTRHLAAVMALDVVGYSRMMGADEAAALAAVRRLRAEVLGPQVAGNRGLIVKSMGDGWLVTFASVVDAVNTALGIQDTLISNTLQLRIGVHVGDVIGEEGDIFGDGVNIAARLEAIAAPGGVTISDTAYSSLDGTLSPVFADGGMRSLKNIARPVRVWERGKGAGQADQSGISTSAAGGFPVLAIQPIALPEDTDILRGIGEALIQDFATYTGSARWLSSSIAVEPPPSAYVLRAMLRGRGERLRLEARLTDADGREIWSGKFDGTLADSFDWQDQVAEEVSGSVLAAILDRETRQLAELPDDRLTPHQCLLAGLLAWRDISVPTFRASLTYLSRAIEKDPGMASAYAEAFFICAGARTMDLNAALGEFFDKLPGWQAAAGRIANPPPVLELNLAILRYFEDYQIAALNEAIGTALRRAPFDLHVLNYAGWGYIYIGQPENARACMEKCLRLSRIGPSVPGSMGGLATASLQMGDDDAAEAYARKGLALTDRFVTLHCVMAAVHARKGRMEEARASVARALELAPDDTLSRWRALNDYGGSEGGRRYFDALRLAGYPE